MTPDNTVQNFNQKYLRFSRKICIKARKEQAIDRSEVAKLIRNKHRGYQRLTGNH